MECDREIERHREAKRDREIERHRERQKVTET
jgi:hypothetical protein